MVGREIGDVSACRSGQMGAGMRKFRDLAAIFLMVNACVEIAVAFFTTAVNPAETVETAVLWQIPLVSLLCTLGNLFYPGNRTMKRRERWVRIAVHYLYINVVVLGAGYLFRWFQFSRFKSVAAMVLTITLIFGLVSLAFWTKSDREARWLNQRLEEYQKETKAV